MKRFASVITGISLIALLAACGSEPQPSNTTTAQSQAPAAEATAAPAETQASASEAQASNPEVQPSAAQPTAATASTAAILTEEDAKNIALTDAGVTEADVTGIRVKLDTDHGVQEYEVEFYAGNLEYDYDIDAATGQIRSKDMDIEDDFFPVQTGNVTIAEADAIALVLEDESRLLNVTEEIYEVVALQTRCHPSNVERNIRTVVLCAWHTNRPLLVKMAGFTLTAPPRASQFIDIIASYIQREVLSDPNRRVLI